MENDPKDSYALMAFLKGRPSASFCTEVVLAESSFDRGLGILRQFVGAEKRKAGRLPAAITKRILLKG
jgi:hypothetical protein